MSRRPDNTSYVTWRDLYHEVGTISRRILRLEIAVYSSLGLLTWIATGKPSPASAVGFLTGLF